MAALCFNDDFVFSVSSSSSSSRERGASYLLYAIINFSAYLYLLVVGWKQMQRETGIRRVETQFLTVILSISWLYGAAATSLGNLLHFPMLRISALYVFFASIIIATWAMLTRRFVDVREILLRVIQRTAVTVIFCIAIFGFWLLNENIKTHSLDIFLAIAIASSFAFWLDRKSREWLGIGDQRTIANLRRTAIEIALAQPHPDKLVAQFEALLKEKFQSSFAMVLRDESDALIASRLKLARNSLDYKVLCETEWATPESIERLGQKIDLSGFRRLFTIHSIGAIVAVPSGSRKPSLAIALGIKTSQWPFTYLEILRLRNIAELMDNILTRSRLTTQAALNARIEHLAMMSRGLAHDLKNLITPISTYLVHADNRSAVGSPGAEVYYAAKRSVRVMTDYVREALFFAERLAPHFQPVDLAVIYSSVREIVTTRASQHGVTLSFQGNWEEKVVADAILLQRLLVNLVNNAIDASATGQTVTVSASQVRPGWVNLQVGDEGAGIAPELIGKIFEPYFTTKQFGDDVRGFGLGLTICQKIADVHNGTITVKSESGQGAKFTLSIPVSPAA